MTIKEFIEAAIEGEWLNDYRKGLKLVHLDSERGLPDVLHLHFEGDGSYMMVSQHRMFLDPKAWRAVGKVKGWDRKVCKYCGHPEIMAGELGYSECCNQWIRNEWVDQYYWNMLRMVKTLCDGKTIEEFIATL